MIQVRSGADRGRFDHGWLQTQHTFSFGEFYDPDRMGFRSVRVINEDHVAPGRGFGMHPHRDMEIITIVLAGALEHQDSLGNGEVLRPGEVQRMSAGSGIRHSEFNPSATESVHLYQIWLQPKTNGITPSYEQQRFAEADRVGAWQLIVSPDASRGSLQIHQDARLFLATIPPRQTLSFDLTPGRAAWVQVLRGAVQLVGQELRAGDGASVQNESILNFASREGAKVLLFDLA